VKSWTAERDFQRTLIEYARLRGWRVYHARPALTQRGRWLTPVQGDVGFPDLVLARQGRLIFAELKREGRKPTPLQQGWLEVLATCPCVEVYVWTPRDWNAIVEILR
jgi:hypothetical protein